MSITVLPLRPFPTSAPLALGGTTPSVNIAAPRGLLSGISTSGSAVVRLLVWNAGLAAWDVMTVNGQQVNITPDSSIPGGVDQVEFDVATPAYFAAQLTTSAPNFDIANLTVDIGLAPGAVATGVAQIFSVLPAAGGVTIHAAVAGTAANTFPGPFTQPDVPRNVAVDASALSYDGGDVTIVGTDAMDAPLTEVLTPNGGAAATGSKAFKTITGASKATVGVDPATVTIVTPTPAGKNHYGVGFAIAGPYGLAQQQTGTAESIVVDLSANTVTFGTAPNGTIRFNAVLQG